MADIAAYETPTKLGAALAKAQAEFKGVGKSGQNAYDKYSYANLEDFVAATKSVLAKHGFSIITSVLDAQSLPDRTTKGGSTEHAVRVKIALRLLHESGEWIEATSWGEGQDRADKAVYKAITGARKYGLASMLGLATTDDPESDEMVERDQGTPERRPAPSPKPATPQAAQSSSAATPAPSGQTTSQAAPPDPGTEGDLALTMDSGPCADCGKDYLMESTVAKYIKTQRANGKDARWSHKAIPTLGCEKAATIAEKQAKSKES